MTGAAIRNVWHAAHVVFLDQGRTQLDLVGVAVAVDHHGRRARRRLVAHVEDLVARAQVILRGAMAS